MKTERAGSRVVATLVVAGLAGLLALAVEARVARADDVTAAKCIRVRGEARYRALGYNHIVIVTNTCAAPAECDVSTDVNPQPTHVSVPGGGEVEVTTFLGSPARVFVPKAECKMGAH